MVIFDLSKRPAVRMCWDDPRKAFVGLYHCAKFGGNRCSSFDNMHVFGFRKFQLKMPIHAPKWVF